MADKIKTNLEQVLLGGSGTKIISDTVLHDNLKVISFVPESDSVFEILTHVDPDGVETNAITTRNLGSVTSASLYAAGINSYFSKIKLTSGSIGYNEA
jgi:hypothetical protein